MEAPLAVVTGRRDGSALRDRSNDETYAVEMVLVRAGAVTAAVISYGLWTLVIVRDVRLNVLNGWTIMLGLLASCLAFAAEKHPVAGVASIMLLIMAMVPALIGGLGLLFLVPIALIVAALPRLRRADDGSAVESAA